jgi:hypothetical protein
MADSRDSKIPAVITRDQTELLDACIRGQLAAGGVPQRE